MDFEFTDPNLKVSDKEKLIEKYSKAVIAPTYLELCVGAQVMLLCNLDVENGLVNGSRGIVLEFIDNIPVVGFFNGSKIIDSNTWEIKEGDDVICRITQLPLKLAWAFTVHKSQAITLDYAEVDLGNMFTYGQAYVALSRVKNLEGLSILDINFNKIKAHPKAVEYYKLLLDTNEPGRLS